MTGSFSYTVDKQAVTGNLKKKLGTFTSSGGATGGAIVTGLYKIYGFTITNTSGTSVSAASVSISGGTATITTDANVVGLWTAEGY